MRMLNGLNVLRKYKSPTILKIDYEEVDLEEFGSGNKRSDDLSVREKRALKKLAKAHRPVDGLVYSDNFYIECRGKVPVFNDGGPVCKESGPLENKPKGDSVKCNKKSKKKGQVGESIKCPWAKQMAEEKLFGDWAKQYAQLRQYALELKEKNPKTTIKIDVERCFDVESQTRQFRRIYICLGALKNGFKAVKASLWDLDVVEGETKESWLWFLDCLGDDLELFRNSNFTFISDRQKGRTIQGPLVEKCNCYNSSEVWKEYGRDQEDLIKEIITGLRIFHHNIWHRSHDLWFKVNPCNGPESWPESDTPITLTAPNYKPPIGRPKKKRRKSAAEIYDNLVKRGKLSRAGGTLQQAYKPSCPQAPPSSSKIHKLHHLQAKLQKSSQDSPRFTKSTATRKKNGSNAKVFADYQADGRLMFQKEKVKSPVPLLFWDIRTTRSVFKVLSLYGLMY
ncbi:hypothetical protein Tco_0393695 [Tanacetum coccineum]